MNDSCQKYLLRRYFPSVQEWYVLSDDEVSTKYGKSLGNIAIFLDWNHEKNTGYLTYGGPVRGTISVKVGPNDLSWKSKLKKKLKNSSIGKKQLALDILKDL